MSDKKIISNRCDGVRLVGDGLALGGIAKKHKKEDPSVINATLGTLYDENGLFYRMNNVDKVLKNFNDENFYNYSPSDGGAEFCKAAINWVFGSELEKMSDMGIKCVATPGGTGAVNNALYIALDQNETLLLPDLYWSPYLKMADVSKVKVENYQMIVENKFNLEGFKEKASEIIKKQNKFVTILNDPCNNPTGYSLTNEEFKELIEFLNAQSVPCTVIYDIAYFDYFVGGMEEAREKFALMTNAKENVLFNVAFSASKTFSIYGLRLGAEIFVSKDKDVVQDAYDVANCLARTRWSNVNRAAVNLMVEVDKNEELKTAVVKDIEEANALVQKRIKIFNDEAKEVGLDVYPATGGFFVCVNCADGNKLANDLQKEKIYVLPFSKVIRIALCSIPCVEIEGLAKKIKDCMDKSVA